jgi:hypothetical protein
MYSFSKISKSLLCLVLLWLGTGTAHALTSINNNFTMIDPSGATMTGGANDVVATWDETLNTSSTGTNFNMTLSSATPFFGSLWTAHDIRVFGPGTYTFNTGCTVAELQTTGGATCAINGTPLTMTVGPGQIGAHMLFDWSVNTNIDVVIVWNTISTFGPSSMFTPGGGNPATLWSLSSSDANGDGKSGIPMVDGPFQGFGANFNILLTGVVTACIPGQDPACTPPSIEAPDTNVGSRFGLGCSMSTKPINPLEHGDWWLLLGFVAWLGFVARRKRA